MFSDNYDLSKVIPNGSHLLAVAFDLPYCLHLPDGHYRVTHYVNEQIVLVTVQTTAKRRQEQTKRGFFVPADKAEKFADSSASYRYTSMIVYIPFESPDLLDCGDLAAQLEALHPRQDWFLEQVIALTNQFLSLYRYVSGEYHIQALSGPGRYFDHRLALFQVSQNERTRASSVPGIQKKVYSDYDIKSEIQPLPEEAVDDFRSKLAENFSIPFSDELILNAYGWLYQGNYRLAIIDAETGFEAAIYNAMRPQYNGHPEDLEKINSFTSVLRTRVFRRMIRQAGKSFEQGTPYYEKWDRLVWKRRGAIIHGRQFSVTYQEAAESIQVVEDVLEYLFGRPSTNPWRYLKFSPIKLKDL